MSLPDMGQSNQLWSGHQSVLIIRLLILVVCVSFKIACNGRGLALAALNLGKLRAQAYNIPLAVKGRAGTQAASAKPYVIGRVP